MAFDEAGNNMPLARAKKRREEQMATIYANPSGQRSVGIALVGWASFGRAGPRWRNFHDWRAGSILAAATVAGGALFAMGIKRLNLVKRYRDAIGCAISATSTKSRPAPGRYN